MDDGVVLVMIVKPTLWRELKFWYRVWRLPTRKSRMIAISMYRFDRDWQRRQREMLRAQRQREKDELLIAMAQVSALITNAMKE